LKKRLQTKHCAATPRKPQRKGSTAGSCVSAIVRSNKKEKNTVLRLNERKKNEKNEVKNFDNGAYNLCN
jgi:hypothetical protein